jgi:cell division septum initiation protein DivIVA
VIPVPKDEYRKVTFYADADVKKWLDSLDAGIKSYTINKLLRKGFSEAETILERLTQLEQTVQGLQKDGQNNRFSVAAVRRVLMNQMGAHAAAELDKEFDDIFYGSTPVGTKKPEPFKAPEQKPAEKPLPGPSFERYSEKATRVIALAQEESRRTGHNFVGTEQLLLGVIGEGTSIAAKTVKSMRVNLKNARSEVEKIIGRGSGFVSDDIPFTPRAKRVLAMASTEARHLQQGHIGPEHLLLGVIREGEGVGIRVLENLGVNVQKLRKAITEAAKG